MIKLFINDRNVQVPAGISILRAADLAGITIPTLCDQKDLTPHGSCQLCIVDLKGETNPVTSCATEVKEGMYIRTESMRLTRLRKEILKMLLSVYYDDSLTRSGLLKQDTQFMHWVRHYQVNPFQYRRKTPRFPIDQDPNPLIQVDFNKCILCMRCVRVCQEIQGRSVWGAAERGRLTHIIAGSDTDMISAGCELCGACAAVCPTAAISDRNTLHAVLPSVSIQSTCQGCSLGCPVQLSVTDGQVVQSLPARESTGVLCAEGRYGFTKWQPGGLSRYPRVRKELLENDPHSGEATPVNFHDEWVEVDWETAFSISARELIRIRERYGAESLGVITSPNLFNEELFLLNRFARQSIGTNRTGYASFTHPSSIISLPEGSLDPFQDTISTGDILQHSRAVLVVGADVTDEHPVFGVQLRQAVLKRGLKLLFAGSCKPDIANLASVQLTPLPGTEVALIYGLMRVIIENGWEDRVFIQEHADCFDELRASIYAFSLDKISEDTGIQVECLFMAARFLVENKPLAIIFSSRLVQHAHGVKVTTALANLQLLLGNVGKPGAGICYIPQLVNEKGAHILIQNRLDTDRILAAVAQGEVRALYLAGDYPGTLPFFQPADLRRCDLVILQGSIDSPLAQIADIILPGPAPAEKTGSIVNVDGQTRQVNQVFHPRETVLQDWQIVAGITPYLENYGQPLKESIILDQIRADIENFISAMHANSPDASNHRWRFQPVGDRLTSSRVSDEYPLIMRTDRLIGIGIVSTMVDKARGITMDPGQPVLWLNPADIQNFGLSEWKTVVVISEAGQHSATLRGSGSILPGTAYGNFSIAIEVGKARDYPDGVAAVRVEPG